MGGGSVGYQYANTLFERAARGELGEVTIDTIRRWHEAGMSLVEMAMLLQDEHGHTVWDTLTRDEQILLARIDRDPEQADTVRRATVATLDQFAAGATVTLTANPLANDAPSFLLAVDCRLPSLAAAPAVAVTTYDAAGTLKARIDPAR